jgi:hypothetical protein
LIAIGLDIEDDPLTLEEAIGLAAEGILQLVIVDGEPVVDKHLDAMVSSWENRHLDSLTMSHDSNHMSAESSSAWPTTSIDDDTYHDTRKSLEFTNPNLSKYRYDDSPLRDDKLGQIFSSANSLNSTVDESWVKSHLDESVDNSTTATYIDEV